MDWMYNKSSTVDPEEYLLGRRIDKGHFKETSPVNYMRSIKDEPASSHSQADISRKKNEDPLTLIKQKEYEQRKLLFKKSQIKHSDSKLVAVDPVSVQDEENGSKSLDQLIIENLRKLPYNIDLEKFYHSIKEKKKQKKLQKKANRAFSNDKQKLPDTRNRSRDRSDYRNEKQRHRDAAKGKYDDTRFGGEPRSRDGRSSKYEKSRFNYK